MFSSTLVFRVVLGKGSSVVEVLKTESAALRAFPVVTATRNPAIQDRRAAIDYRLVPFGKEAEAPIAELVLMHTAMMPNSLPVLLGREFLKKFYYAILPREGYIQGVVAYIDGEPAGFQVFTTDSDGFMSAAASRHMPELIRILTPEVVRSPRRIQYLINAWQLTRSRGPSATPIAEFMSLGVRELYRTHEFKEHTGIRVAHDLHKYTFEEMVRCGVIEARTIIDDDNRRSREYHEKTGWKLYATDIPGWNVPSVEYRIRPQEFQFD